MHTHVGMGWLRLVGSFQLQVCIGEYSLCNRALLQKKPIILRRLLTVATLYNFTQDLFIYWTCHSWLRLTWDSFVYGTWHSYIYVTLVYENDTRQGICTTRDFFMCVRDEFVSDTTRVYAQYSTHSHMTHKAVIWITCVGHIGIWEWYTTWYLHHTWLLYMCSWHTNDMSKTHRMACLGHIEIWSSHKNDDMSHKVVIWMTRHVYMRLIYNMASAPHVTSLYVFVTYEWHV